MSLRSNFNIETDPKLVTMFEENSDLAQSFKQLKNYFETMMNVTWHRSNLYTINGHKKLSFEGMGIEISRELSP